MTKKNMEMIRSHEQTVESKLGWAEQERIERRRNKKERKG